MQEINPPDQTLRWSIAQRLEFIEFRLVWEGRIKRSDIADRFGVTVQQATVDLGQLAVRKAAAHRRTDSGGDLGVDGIHVERDVDEGRACHALE